MHPDPRPATMKRRPGARGKLDRALALLGFLADMCADRPIRAVVDDERSDEQILADLRSERPAPPLAVRSHGYRDLEKLIATGHVERVGVVPTVLRLVDGKAPTLTTNEAVRLTPKDFDERTREALRAELGEG